MLVKKLQELNDNVPTLGLASGLRLKFTLGKRTRATHNTSFPTRLVTKTLSENFSKKELSAS